MAKMTIGPVTYEGTPEELQAIVMTFPTDDAVVVAPAPTTEKRHAKVGERILIIGATQTDGEYANGDVLTVTESNVLLHDGSVRVHGVDTHIYAREFEVIVEPAKAKSEKPKPADKLSHNGADYSLVQREAQAGDVVVFTGNTSKCVDNEKAYGPVTQSHRSGELLNEEFGYLVYSGNYNRTEANVLVYEKVAEPLKAGDYIAIDTSVYCMDITADKAYLVEENRSGLYFRDDGGDKRWSPISDGAYTKADKPCAKTQIFAKLGRKLDEYKAGDIVKYVGGGGAVGGNSRSHC